MPTGKAPVQSKLSTREAAVCLRLKAIREARGLTQEKFASDAGLTRSALANHEACRSPIRCDLALRICRTFVVSEEWFATGRFTATHKTSIELGHDAKGNWAQADAIFFSQCMDLACEPEFHQVPPSSLYSRAYDDYLAPAYARLIRANFYHPRIVFSERDRPEIVLNFFNAFAIRWLKLLGNEAAKKGVDIGMVQRSFIRAMIDADHVLFKRFMGVPTPEVSRRNFDFLRVITKYMDAPIGPLHPGSVD